MGRKKFELKYIDNFVERKFKFKERIGGILRKIHELSVMCNLQFTLVMTDYNSDIMLFSNNSQFDPGGKVEQSKPLELDNKLLLFSQSQVSILVCQLTHKYPFERGTEPIKSYNNCQDFYKELKEKSNKLDKIQKLKNPDFEGISCGQQLLGKRLLTNEIFNPVGQDLTIKKMKTQPLICIPQNSNLPDFIVSKKRSRSLS